MTLLEEHFQGKIRTSVSLWAGSLTCATSSGLWEPSMPRHTTSRSRTTPPLPKCWQPLMQLEPLLQDGFLSTLSQCAWRSVLRRRPRASSGWLSCMLRSGHVAVLRACVPPRRTDKRAPLMPWCTMWHLQTRAGQCSSRYCCQQLKMAPQTEINLPTINFQGLFLTVSGRVLSTGTILPGACCDENPWKKNPEGLLEVLNAVGICRVVQAVNSRPHDIVTWHVSSCGVPEMARELGCLSWFDSEERQIIFTTTWAMKKTLVVYSI